MSVRPLTMVLYLLGGRSWMRLFKEMKEWRRQRWWFYCCLKDFYLWIIALKELGVKKYSTRKKSTARHIWLGIAPMWDTLILSAASLSLSLCTRWHQMSTSLVGHSAVVGPTCVVIMYLRSTVACGYRVLVWMRWRWSMCNLRKLLVLMIWVSLF